MKTVDARTNILRRYGSSSSDIDELLHYNQSAFHAGRLKALQLPMEDEPSIHAWTLYETAVNKTGSLTALSSWIPQLQFPIQEGISKTTAYQAAVTRGQSSYPSSISTGIKLDEPECCSLILYSTPVGRIPVISTSKRGDFVSLIRAFLKKSPWGL
jgi:hypothetical protein